MIGTALAASLAAQGHSIVRLVRRDPLAGEACWDPSRECLGAQALAGADAVINLAGVRIAGARWTRRRKQAILDSRVQSTVLLAAMMARMPHPPRVFLNASATGCYGDRSDEALDESSRPGEGFLADVAVAWEAAAQPASDAGIRVALLRSGIVLSKRGGALAALRPPFLLGVGGPIGGGRQYWPWISMADVLGAVSHILDGPAISGPVNLVAPQETTSHEFAKALGRALRRPAVIPLPAVAVRLAMGEMGVTLLVSARVRPGKLIATGYAFQHPTLDAALAWACDRRTP